MNIKIHLGIITVLNISLFLWISSRAPYDIQESVDEMFETIRADVERLTDIDESLGETKFEDLVDLRLS